MLQRGVTSAGCLHTYDLIALRPRFLLVAANYQNQPPAGFRGKVAPMPISQLNVKPPGPPLGACDYDGFRQSIEPLR